VPSPSTFWQVSANFDDPAKAIATNGRSPRALRKSIMMVWDVSCELMLRFNDIVIMIIVMSGDVDLGGKDPLYSQDG
jgi:hypothetical protein